MTAEVRRRAQVSAGRDSFLDVLRAVALARVVLWHTYGAFWISYFIASLPIMFFVAGCLMAGSLQRAGAFSVLARRFRRLLLPLWLMAVPAIAVMVTYDNASESLAATLHIREIIWFIFPIWDPRGSEWGVTLWAPLWYLRCLTWLLLASPLLLFLWRQLGPLLLVVPLVGLALAEMRVGHDSQTPWQIQDFYLYGFFWLLGFAYNDGLLDRLSGRINLALCLLFAAAAAAWALSQSIPSGIVNASYPLHLLVALAWLFGALACRVAISAFGVRRRVASLIYWVNERALTIYLWHAAGLFVMYQILWSVDHSQLTRDLLALPIVLSVTFLAVLGFGWAEDLAASRRPRLWPAADATGQIRRRPASAPMSVSYGALAGAGVAAMAICLIVVLDEQRAIVQPTTQTVPASGVGLQIRTARAQLTAQAPATTGPVNAAPVAAEDLQRELDAWHEQWQIGAAISLRRAGVSWSGASGSYEDGSPLSPGDQYWIGSVTKTFTAALVMRLQERELLNLDDPVSDFVPEFPESEHFTVRHLLQHTSGLIVGERPPYQSLLLASAAGLQSEPGSRFEYSRAGYFMLGLIIEDRLGKSFTQAIHDELIDPLELLSTLMDDEIDPLDESTHPFAGLDPDYQGVEWSSAGLHRDLPEHFEYRGVYWSSGGLYSTTRDLATWASALWGSDTVVQTESLDLMTSFLDEDFAFTGLGTYGFCPCWWEADRLRSERWAHLGASGGIEYDPAGGIALAIHLSDLVNDVDVIAAMDDLSARIRGLVQGRPFAADVSTASP